MTKREGSRSSILDRVSSGAAFIAGLGVLAITAMVTFDVLMRYFLDRPQLFVDELASFILVGVIFWGTARTFQKGGHIQIDLLTNRLRPKLQRIFRILTLAMGIFFLITVTWETVASSIIAFEQERVSAVMIYPLWIPMLLIPIGLVIMMLVMGVSLIHQFRPEQERKLEGSPAESND